MGTQRTKAALDALFPTNGNKEISADRLRDFLESCLPSTAGLHFDDPGTPTAIAVAGTPVKATNVSTAHDLYRFTHPVDNRLLYGGTVAVKAQVTATLSFTCAANNQVLAFYIAVNDVVIASSKIRSKIATGADVQAVTITAHPTLNPGDYIEVWVANETSDADLTVEHGHVHAVAFLT
jgi:hypothetical protein